MLIASTLVYIDPQTNAGAFAGGAGTLARMSAQREGRVTLYLKLESKSETVSVYVARPAG